MRYRSISRKQPQERGQTIALVALTIVTLLAMAALAIDVVTLYVAKGEVQRAADAAALVAAKAFVDSGVTSDPTNTSLQTLAENMANAGINAILAQNKVAGAAPVLVGTPTFYFLTDPTTHPGNPQVAVTLQRTGLPIFFARIWRTAAATVTASAKAEAYNPAKSQTTTGNYIPVTLKNIKPLLIANQEGTNKFITDASGGVVTNQISQDITLVPGCQSGGGGPSIPCLVTGMTLGQGQLWPIVSFWPAIVSSATSTLCPSCEGSSDFEQGIECGQSQLNSTGSAYSCGGTTTNAYVDTTMTRGNVRNLGRAGAKCLINDPANDTIDSTNFPSGPMQITAHSGPFSGQLVSTSRSIATFPIIDNSTAITIPPGDVKIIGFLQGFIETVTPGGSPLQITVKILNISGCGNNPGSTSVQAGGTSAIPVRLISQ